MRFKRLNSLFMITLTILGSTLVLSGLNSNFPTIPNAHAAPPNNPGILGLFNEALHTNTIIVSQAQNVLNVWDVNVTDAGLLKGFDINVTFTATQVSFATSSFSGTGCPKSAGCLFDGLTVLKNFNGTGLGGNSYRLNLVDNDGGTPFVSGTGILFRMTLKNAVANPASVIHFTANSVLQNPASVPHSNIDGYIDAKATASDNYNIAVSAPNATIIRPVSQFAIASTSGLTVSLSSLAPASQPTITLKALSLPGNTAAVFSPGTCTAACTPTFTITIHGGPQGAAGTTPSGTYFIPVTGNSTTAVGILIKVAWFKLIVKPPALPVYTVSSDRTSFTQELGNWTLIHITSTLTSGSNDTVNISSDCSTQLNGGACVFTDTSANPGKFPFSANMNVSTQVTTTTVGLHYIHALITTSGTYSESAVTMPTEPAIFKVPSLDNVLIVDPKIRFVKSGTNTTWVPGETAVYDFDGNGTYNPNPKLSSDSHIRFVNQTVADASYISTSGLNKTLIYDANSNGVLDSGEPIIFMLLKTDSNIKFVDGNSNSHWDSGEAVLCDAPCLGNSLTADNHIKFVNASNTDTWNSAKKAVYDSNNNGVYDSGEPVIAGTAPTVGTKIKNDPKFKVIDYNGNGVWNSGEPIIYDNNNNNVYDSTNPGGFCGTTITTDCIINSALNTLHTGLYNVADTLIAGVAPSVGTPLMGDAKIRYADANNNNNWNPGETVVYDTNGNAILDSGESIINIGAMKVKTDGLVKFVDLSSFNGVWNTGETVAYDANNNAKIDTGDTVIVGGVDTVLSGTAPSAGTALFADSKMKFVDTDGSGHWDCTCSQGLSAGDPGEPIGYDNGAGVANNNGVYDVGVAIAVTVVKTHDLAAGTVNLSRSFAYAGVSLPLASQLKVNVTVTNRGTGSETFIVNATAKTILNNDFKILFNDTNVNGNWDPGESIIYDTDSSFSYSAGDVVIAGGTPTLTSSLSLDLLLKYVDAKFKGTWAAGDAVAYDTNSNGMYDTGEPVPAGSAPSGGVLIASQSVTLGAGLNQTVTLSWDPGSLPRTSYNIFGAAVPVLNEFLVSNNVAQYSLTFKQKLKGDVNGDCKVDIVDLATVGSTFGKTIGTVGYNPAADLNDDGVINIVDLVLVAGSFGQSC